MRTEKRRVEEKSRRGEGRLPSLSVNGQDLANKIYKVQILTYVRFTKFYTNVIAVVLVLHRVQMMLHRVQNAHKLSERLH